MQKFNEALIEEHTLTVNAKKTALYLIDALIENDFESAKLEMSELAFSMQRLEELKTKRKRRNQLLALVADMQKRGIDIGFARRSSFFDKSAKNADENSQNTTKNIKKRQQA